MVLWEITVATAYFLGLKRTYRLALRIQRRLVGLRHPKIRQLLQRKSRVVFDIALSVHKKVQERDLDVGRNLGNWILRWLDHAKPSAQIRPSPPVRSPITKVPKLQNGRATRVSGSHNQSFKMVGHDSARRLFSTPWNIRHKSFPTIAMMMQLPRSAGIGNQYRQLSYQRTSTWDMINGKGPQSVFRKDIAQWMVKDWGPT